MTTKGSLFIYIMILMTGALLIYACNASAKDYPVTFFGIQSGSTVLNTRYIQYWIDYINQNGGCRLVFAAGTYLTGCIHFKSDVTLHNNVFDTNRSAIALEAVDGAIIENIEVDGIEGINIGNAIFLRAGARKRSRKGRVKNITIQNVNVVLRAEKNPIKNMPGVVIAGMPDQIITDVILKNIVLKFPRGADSSLAAITLNNIKDIPEKPNSYPEYNMFDELPTWGVYIRHAGNMQFTGLNIAAAKTDFRTAIVLDDVHKASFSKVIVREPGKKKKIFTCLSSEISSR